MQTKIRLWGGGKGDFFLRINKRAGTITIHVQDGINMQGEIFPQSLNVQTKKRPSK